MLALTIAGFILKKARKDTAIRNVLMVSSWFMVFLLLVTITIQYITDSMP
ncbi:hypothetical protein V7087_10795 [Neobacillus niacini]